MVTVLSRVATRILTMSAAEYWFHDDGIISYSEDDKKKCTGFSQTF